MSFMDLLEEWLELREQIKQMEDWRSIGPRERMQELREELDARARGEL